MPDVLWSLFSDNRRLLQALPTLAACVIETQMRARHGLKVGVTAVPHTFNHELRFNPHVHTMVTAGGLHTRYGEWVHRSYYDQDHLMRSWRRVVIKLLRAALEAGQLLSSPDSSEIRALLADQERRWWSIKIQSFASKVHFLGYAGRYVRRPPIARK